MNQNSMPALAIDALVKRYPDGNVLAVDGASFVVKKGEIFSLLGPNGAGKSTTINIAATSLEPTSGKVTMFGHDVVNDRASARSYIGICPQDLVFYENLTVMENLMFFGRMHGLPKATLQPACKDLIDKVGLAEKKDVLASKLSGGMKRRLNVIIAMVNDPAFLILDEPTAGLDPQTRRLVWDFLKDLKARGKTVLLTTHYMDEADVLSDRIAIIDHGKIIALDTPFSLKQKHSRGDIIEFKFSDSNQAVRDRLLALPGDNECRRIQEVEGDEGLFRLAMHDGLASIGKVLATLASAGLSISDMAIKSNTLENVFIALTGRTIRE